MSGGDWKDLFIACRDGDIETVKYHVMNNIDINYQHPEILTTPLLEAIRNQHVEIIHYLLEQGADPKIREGFGTTDAIKQAKKIKNKEIIRLVKSYL